jgi:hypothetical protein
VGKARTATGVAAGMPCPVCNRGMASRRGCPKASKPTSTRMAGAIKTGPPNSRIRSSAERPQTDHAVGHRDLHYQTTEGRAHGARMVGSNGSAILVTENGGPTMLPRISVLKL